MEYTTKELLEKLSISTKTWEKVKAEDKKAFLENMGLTVDSIDKKGRSIVYTVSDIEEALEKKELLSIFSLNLDINEYQNFKYALNVWINSNVVITNKEMAANLGHADDRKIRYWREKANEIGLLDGVNQDLSKPYKYKVDGTKVEATEKEWKAYVSLINQFDGNWGALIKYSKVFNGYYMRRVSPARASRFTAEYERIVELISL